MLQVRYWLLGICIVFTMQLHGQGVGYGLTAKTDLYQRFVNPEDEIANRSAGGIFSLGLGPKLWIGGENMSFSAEASFNYAPFAISLDDYKGMGAMSFPLMAKFNFGGTSTHNREGKFGLSVGGGIQYSRTELYGLRGSFADMGVTRNYFRTYVAEVGYGFGLSGFAIMGYVRYGRNTDLKANTFNFGIAYDFNLPVLKELTDPEF